MFRANESSGQISTFQVLLSSLKYLLQSDMSSSTVSMLSGLDVRCPGFPSYRRGQGEGVEGGGGKVKEGE